MMHTTALEKIKKEADEKLHRPVRGKDTCMMMRMSPESSYIVPKTRMARNGTSSFELDEHPPIMEDDHSRLGLDENVQTDNGCREVNSGLEEIHERTTTAVQNGDTELEGNPNFKKNELNNDREVSDRCCVINTVNTTQLPDNQVEHMKYNEGPTTFIMSRNSREFKKLMARLEKTRAPKCPPIIGPCPGQPHCPWRGPLGER